MQLWQYKGQDSVPCAPADGQQDGVVLHQPLWVSYTVTHGLPTVGVVPEKGVPLPAEYLPGSRNVTADQEFGHSIIC